MTSREADEFLTCPWYADENGIRVQVGPEPERTDPLIGRMIAPVYAERAATVHSEWLRLGLIDRGDD